MINLHPQLRWRQRIPAIARRQATAEGSATTGNSDGIAAGEDALLAQNGPAARDAFACALSRISPEADSPITDDEARAWAGLALSLADEGDHAAATALSLRPDLVRAVYAVPGAHRSTTPVEVARWLAPVVHG